MSSGSSRCTGPGRSSWATRNASRTMVGIEAALTICRVILVSGFIEAMTSTIWKRAWRAVMIAFWPVIMIIGMAPRCAYAAAVEKLSAPGPSVEMHTPGRPVSRPWVAAMNPAACSCRVSTSWIFEPLSDSTTSRFSSPGTPKMRSTPSLSSAATRRSEPLDMSEPPRRFWSKRGTARSVPTGHSMVRSGRGRNASPFQIRRESLGSAFPYDVAGRGLAEEPE